MMIALAAVLITVLTGAAGPAAGQELGRGVPTGLDPAGLLRALNGLPSTPNTAWGVDPATGQVVVTVSDAAPAAGVARLLALADRAGTDVRIRHTTGRITEQLLGGDQISDGRILCSVGFNVTRAGQDYVLTAGHCTTGLPYWEDLGPSLASNFPNGDFGLVRNDSGDASGSVDRYDGTVQPIDSVGTAKVGERVCASGQTTGITCGQVLAVDQTVDYGDGHVVHGLIETNVHTDHGDSGGPLFDGDVGLGTVSGGDGQTDFFQPLAPELAAYGVTLVGRW